MCKKPRLRACWNVHSRFVPACITVWRANAFDDARVLMTGQSVSKLYKRDKDSTPEIWQGTGGPAEVPPHLGGEQVLRSSPKGHKQKPRSSFLCTALLCWWVKKEGVG